MEIVVVNYDDSFIKFFVIYGISIASSLFLVSFSSLII